MSVSDSSSFAAIVRGVCWYEFRPARGFAGLTRPTGEAFGEGLGGVEKSFRAGFASRGVGGDGVCLAVASIACERGDARRHTLRGGEASAMSSSTFSSKVSSADLRRRVFAAVCFCAGSGSASE